MLVVERLTLGNGAATVVLYRPRPNVAATRSDPIHNNSETITFAGPPCGTCHVAPASSLVKMPISVAAYSQFGLLGWISRSCSGTAGSDAARLPLTLLHDRPPSVVLQTLSALNPPKVAYTRLPDGSSGSIVRRVSMRFGRPAPLLSTRVHVG